MREMAESIGEGYSKLASILEITKGIKMDPDNALLYAERSQSFRVIQQYYHAVKDAERVIALRPKWYKGYYYKGLAEFDAEHHMAAVESFEDGLEYSSDADLIKALQKASRAMFITRMTKRFRIIQGFVLGLVVGGLALAANDFLLPSPIVKNTLLKIVLFAAWGFCGTETAKNYSKILEKDKNKRLEAPQELFPLSDVSNREENRDTTRQRMSETTQQTVDNSNEDNGPETGQTRQRILIQL